jgi:hypothetical protein
MELIVLLALYVLGLGILLYGFYNRNVVSVLFGAVVLMASGAILFGDGYNSTVSCTDSSQPTSCRELTNILYGADGKISDIRLNVVKMNATNSKLSYAIGAGSFFLGIIAAFIALLGKIGDK